MSAEQKTLLTTAFEATGHTWNDCFLALAIPMERTRADRHTRHLPFMAWSWNSDPSAANTDSRD
jgi:cation diffusion facilitator CzcD-associated flavoprotein CzcO